MIRHIVTWKLKATDAAGRAESVAAIVGALQPLAGSIPDVLSLAVHANEAYFEANWDVVLIADYPSVAALDAYQVHPEHKTAAAVVREHVAERASIDFEV